LFTKKTSGVKTIAGINNVGNETGGHKKGRKP